MKYVKVAFKQAEKVKKQLFELEVFDKRYTILKDDGFVYFPVIKKVKNFTIVNKNLFLVICFSQLDTLAINAPFQIFYLIPEVH